MTTMWTWTPSRSWWRAGWRRKVADASRWATAGRSATCALTRRTRACPTSRLAGTHPVQLRAASTCVAVHILAACTTSAQAVHCVFNFWIRMKLFVLYIL
jgi:hypothetical protein